MTARKLTIREGILDSLIQYDYSITSIQNYLKYLEAEKHLECLSETLDINTLKKELVIMLSEEIITISYPENSHPQQFIEIENESINDFRFELTEKGVSEWDDIPD